MTRTITDSLGDEISAADFDDYQPPAYKRTLARHPDCRDPDHPGCPKCEDDEEDEEDHQEVDTPDINEEPVPYDDNAPTAPSGKYKLTIKPVVLYTGTPVIDGDRARLTAVNHPRFPAYYPVRTSTILYHEGGRIETKNTIYLPEETKP